MIENDLSNICPIRNVIKTAGLWFFINVIKMQNVTRMWYNCFINCCQVYFFIVIVDSGYPCVAF